MGKEKGVTEQKFDPDDDPGGVYWNPFLPSAGILSHLVLHRYTETSSKRQAIGQTKVYSIGL